MPTLQEIYRRAERAIERDEAVIYDVAADWFRRAVAEELFGAAVVAEAIAADNFCAVRAPR